MTYKLLAWEYHVYALIDPRDGSIRYVGLTSDPRQRLWCHLSERTNAGKWAWMCELKERGLRPRMETLEVITNTGWDIDKAIRAEHDWLLKLQADGHPLLNKVVPQRGTA